jgi:DNA-binding CsgD family transcriptional regulator
LALRRNLGDKAGIASSLLNLSELARDQGNFIYAGELLAESITLHTALEDRNALLFCLNSQAHLIYYQGDDSRAAEMFQETLVLAQKYDDTFHTASACYFLGMLSLRQNDTARAQTLLAQALELYRKVGNQREIARVLEGHAAFAVAQGMMAEAAQFYGAAAALRESIDAPLPPVDQGSYAQLVASIRARCGAEACAIHWTKGRTMTMDQISAIYQTCLTPTNIHNAPDSKPLSQTTYPAGLTPREAEVLRLLSTGLTNRQIAEQLVLSHLTVGAHLRSIYSKVGVTTRAAATRFAVEQRIT